MHSFPHTKTATEAFATPHKLGVLVLIAGMGISITAPAQTKIVPQGNIESAKDDAPSGWSQTLGVSGTINFVSNDNVVGQVEGLSILTGLGLTGSVDHTRGKSLWRNKLSVSEGFARTPVIDQFVKTNDIIDVESTYNYFLLEKLGGFARLNIKTSLFAAHAVTADARMYQISSAEPGGAVEGVLTNDLRVAAAFKPLTLAESAGGFAEPYKSEHLSVRLRAGLGGRHTFASGVLVNKDDAATPGIIEMQELANVHQAGAELFIGLDGKAKRGRVTYSAGAGLLLPFINNDAFDRSATELISLGVQAEVKVAVFDWMAVVYKANLLVDPQLFPAGEELTQFQNSLLLTFQYTLIERKPKPRPRDESAPEQPTPEQLELQAAILARDAAEQRAREATERADTLERELLEAIERATPVEEPQPVESQPEETP